MRGLELGYLLRVSRCFDSYRRQQLKDVELYPALHLFVSHVCRHPGCAQEALGDALCVDKTTVAHHLARLEEKGYIERKPSPEDGRCRLVYPTEKATKLYPRLRAAYDAFYRGLLEDLCEEDRAQVERLGEMLYRNAKKLMQEL